MRPGLPLRLLLPLLAVACGGAEAPPPPPEEPVVPQRTCPQRSYGFDDDPLTLTCADAPELCAPAAPVHVGASPLGTVDVLFVPEAFTGAELPDFRAEVDAHVADLLTRQPDFAAYRDRLRFFRLDVASATSDVVDADVTDTAFGGCTVNGVLPAVDSQRVRLAAQARAPRPTVVVILSNRVSGPGMRGDGGLAALQSTGGLAYVMLARGVWSPVFAHELGHALLFLGDEYGAPTGAARTCYDAPLPAFSTADTESFPNLTVDRTGARWSHIDPGVEPGGSGFDCGIYNPPGACMMGEDITAPLCKVCRAHLDALFAGLAGEDDGPPRCDLALSQLPDALRGVVYVSGRWVDYSGLDAWELLLDGAPFASGRPTRTGFREGVMGSPFAVLDTAKHADGAHTLTLRCTDRHGQVASRDVAVTFRNAPPDVVRRGPPAQW